MTYGEGNPCSMFCNGLLNVGYVQIDFFLSFLSHVKGNFQNVCYLYTVYELIHNDINRQSTHRVSSIIKDSELRSSPENN